MNSLNVIQWNNPLIAAQLRWFYESHPTKRIPISLGTNLCTYMYTVPTGNRTPGIRVAVHYTTAAPRKLHS